MGPNAGRLGPCPCTAPADLQLGTPSAYSLKTHGTDVPERQKENNKLWSYSACLHIKLNPIKPRLSTKPKFDEIISTHPPKLIHRLVVEPRANDVKWRHADGHGDAADHGCDQCREPSVWTEPLERNKEPEV